MISQEQILLYMDLFRGRKDIYAKHWEKNGKSGYSPAYEFNWPEFMAFKSKGGRLVDFPNKKQLVLELIRKALNLSEFEKEVGNQYLPYRKIF